MDDSHLNVAFLYPEHPCPWYTVATVLVKAWLHSLSLIFFPPALSTGQQLAAEHSKLCSFSWTQTACEPEGLCLPAELWWYPKFTLNFEGPLIYPWEKGPGKKKLPLFQRPRYNFSLPSSTVGDLPTQDFRELGSSPRFAWTTVTSPLWASPSASGKRLYYIKIARYLGFFPCTHIPSYCPPYDKQVVLSEHKPCSWHTVPWCLPKWCHQTHMPGSLEQGGCQPQQWHKPSVCDLGQKAWPQFLQLKDADDSPYFAEWFLRTKMY